LPPLLALLAILTVLVGLLDVSGLRLTGAVVSSAFSVDGADVLADFLIEVFGFTAFFAWSFVPLPEGAGSCAALAAAAFLLRLSALISFAILLISSGYT